MFKTTYVGQGYPKLIFPTENQNGFVLKSFHFDKSIVAMTN